MQTIQRLTDFFVPESYNLSLTIERIERQFSGTVTITGDATESADCIKLHAKDLSIQSVAMNGKHADFVAAENDEIVITQPDLAAGKQLIVIAFSGKITDAMHGLYPCYYNHDGKKYELLATQFESHHAREVFPCIDEPAAKATFDVTLTTEANIVVLGNMPVLQQSLENERLVTTFERTPKMSSYLLALVIGNMHKKSSQTAQGVEVNVWSTPAQPAESLDFALDIAVRTIEFYNDYFGTAYPLPKSDHVALPDFTSGAMENWGLITYRETTLLADPATTSISSRQYIATVIAHELAHQWFGNLVTMQWWNYLWLNESFATLMEYIAIDALHPEWDVWLDFAGGETIIALRRDSIDGVQPVQLDVNHPDEISTLFDGAIVYAKGARLLRMLQKYVGDNAFQDGLKNYFQVHAYANTEGADLWRALSDSSGKDIAQLMDSWVSTPGFPVVYASVSGDTLQLEQNQFFVGPHAESQTIWPIPLNSLSSELPLLMESKNIEIPYTGGHSIRLNDGDASHFITKYDDVLFASILQDIRENAMTPINKMQVLNEAMLLARAGTASSASLIDLLDAFADETSEPVWGVMAATVAELRKFVETNEQAEKDLRSFCRSIAENLYQRLGWEKHDDEPESDTKLRSLAIGLMVYGEDAGAINTAKTIYDSADLTSVDPELRALVIGARVRHSDEVKYVELLLNIYKKSSSGELRHDICAGATSTKNPKEIQLILDAIKDSNTIRPQDVTQWFVFLIRNRDARSQAWDWLQENWQWIEKTFGSDKSYDSYPRYAASALSTPAQLIEYKKFFADKKSIPALSRVIAMGESEIEGRVELIERDSHVVQQKLSGIQ